MKWLDLHLLPGEQCMDFECIKSQWVDLGIHTEACMTRPETCGAAGGAISVWLNVTTCPGYQGIISSYDYLSTGLIIFCYNENIRYDTHTHVRNI